MESNAYWTVDNKRDKRIKAYCCLFAIARDYAKLGQLYLDSGRFNGRQIIPQSWIAQISNPDTFTRMGYINQWWRMVHYETCTDSAKCLNNPKYNRCIRNVIKRNNLPDSITWRCSYFNGDYCAEGLYDQFIYVNPEKKVVIVRLGNDQAKVHFYSSIRTLGWEWR